jgi:hypothetical protein
MGHVQRQVLLVIFRVITSPGLLQFRALRDQPPWYHWAGTHESRNGTWTENKLLVKHHKSDSDFVCNPVNTQTSYPLKYPIVWWLNHTVNPFTPFTCYLPSPSPSCHALNLVKDLPSSKAPSFSAAGCQIPTWTKWWFCGAHWNWYHRNPYSILFHMRSENGPEHPILITINIFL